MINNPYRPNHHSALLSKKKKNYLGRAPSLHLILVQSAPCGPGEPSQVGMPRQQTGANAAPEVSKNFLLPLASPAAAGNRARPTRAGLFVLPNSRKKVGPPNKTWLSVGQLSFEEFFFPCCFVFVFEEIINYNFESFFGPITCSHIPIQPESQFAVSCAADVRKYHSERNTSAVVRQSHNQNSKTDLPGHFTSASRLIRLILFTQSHLPFPCKYLRVALVHLNTEYLGLQHRLCQTLSSAKDHPFNCGGMCCIHRDFYEHTTSALGFVTKADPTSKCCRF